MREKITTILIQKLKEHHVNYTVSAYNDEIIKITVFNYIEVDIDDLDNICGQASFICNVKGQIEGIVHRNRTYSFSFSGVEATMGGTQIIDLNIENMITLPYRRNA